MVMRGNLEEVIEMVEDDPSVVDITNNDGMTPLYYASYHGLVDMVTYLLDHGADI